MSDGNVFIGAASGPILHHKFTTTAHSHVSKVPTAGGMILGRIVPTQATTNFQTATNPVSHVRLPPQSTARGNLQASSNMAFSMDTAFHGGINKAIPYPASHNTNAAPPWLKAYGPSANPSTPLPAESSQFAFGGGGPALLHNKNRKGPLNLRMG